MIFERMFDIQTVRKIRNHLWRELRLFRSSKSEAEVYGTCMRTVNFQLFHYMHFSRLVFNMLFLWPFFLLSSEGSVFFFLCSRFSLVSSVFMRLYRAFFFVWQIQ